MKKLKLKKKDSIVIVTGVFDPLSIEDINFLKYCKKRGDWLIVGLHSDFWAAEYRGGYMQNYDERYKILSELKCVDEIFSFNDSDGTDCQLLKVIKICYPDSYFTYVSEDDKGNMPESKINGITFEIFKQE
jgi:glycerol-3-phosphate cytidylyltransferase-like family protein